MSAGPSQPNCFPRDGEKEVVVFPGHAPIAKFGSTVTPPHGAILKSEDWVLPHHCRKCRVMHHSKIRQIQAADVAVGSKCEELNLSKSGPLL